jgi:hypothetical protein
MPPTQGVCVKSLVSRSRTRDTSNSRTQHLAQRLRRASACLHAASGVLKPCHVASLRRPRSDATIRSFTALWRTRNVLRWTARVGGATVASERWHPLADTQFKVPVAQVLPVEVPHGAQSLRG